MKILIVDDEKNIRDVLGRYLVREGFETTTAGNGFAAQRLIEAQPIHAMIADLKMPQMDGLALIRWVRELGYEFPILMISAHGDISDAVQAIQLGAQDFIVKPFNPETLVLRLKQVLQAEQFRRIGIQRRVTESFIGNAKSIVAIKEVVERVADTPSTVFITGESGTGKEVVAREVHKKSSRKEGPFMAINIGGIPENLLESELFGYEKGAFTGAVDRKMGLFELASGGTLFLDEIGDMPMALQVKILRVLQEKKITRLGGASLIPIDVRIVAATNKDVESLVSEGAFREDLFYRLNVVRIEIPPLRERREDIPDLVNSFLQKYSRSMGKHVRGVSAETMNFLTSYGYPGNIRELENFIERGVIFAKNGEVQLADLAVSLDQQEKKIIPQARTLKALEREAILVALQRWEGSRTRAAEELGVSRRTIINKIQEYGINQ